MTKGTSRLLIGLRSPDLLSSLKPDFEELTRLTPHVGAEGYFVFALSPTNNGEPAPSRACSARRSASPKIRSAATRTACSVSISSITVCCTPKDGRVAFRGRQGQWVRRPGIVEVEVESSGKVAQSVRIVGDAVIVYEAEVQV